MQFSVRHLDSPGSQRSGCLIVTMFSDKGLSIDAKAIDKTSKKALSARIDAEDFKAKCGATLLLHGLPGVTAERVLLCGLGAAKSIDAGSLNKSFGKAFAALGGSGTRDALLCLAGISGPGTGQLLQQAVLAAGHAEYRYTRTLSDPRPPSKLKRLTLLTAGKPSARDKRTVKETAAMANGSNVARELGNLPANICTPSYLAGQARALARKHKSIRTRILNEKAMQDLGMGALLSVTAGTQEPARLIVMEYRGAAASEQPYVLVGKGVTFDSGGISLKPGPGMDEMKFDMGGAASVFGTMNAIADIGPAINVVGIVGAVENMPSGTATRPGDVVTSMAGITIEVLNTDAEGRLVLCDALHYARRYKPRALIDIATLTGACVIALGKHATGMYSNSDKLAAQLLDAGTQAHDRAWRMPLWQDYQEQLKSNFADLANIGGREAGSVTAACFLSRFTEDLEWAHLDIAGSAWDGGANKGSTGRPVRLLTRYLLDRV